MFAVRGRMVSNGYLTEEQMQQACTAQPSRLSQRPRSQADMAGYLAPTGQVSNEYDKISRPYLLIRPAYFVLSTAFPALSKD